MKKILAALVAVAFGLGSLTAFAADDMSKDGKPAKKATKKSSAKKATKRTETKKAEAGK